MTTFRRFVAATARECLRQVRDALGPDAMILSNRPVADGVEIVAAPQNAVAALAGIEALAPPAAPAQAGAPGPAPVRRAPVPDARPETVRPQQPAQQPAQAPWVDTLMQEVRSVRGLLEDQLAALAWGDAQRRDPARSRVLRDLVASGFTPQLARSFAERMPATADAADSTRWMRAALDRNLLVAADENAVIDRGGIYALVGPTGVGKTTTTAKLAARCVVRHGAQKMALLTTDGYRIGAHEQLRIYGRILGVAVHAVKDTADLKLALAELAGKHMVLIDTVGMSQRDRMVTEQVAMLAGAGNVQRLLLLNAAAAGETLDEVVGAYRGDGLAGCILTKVDEAAGLGTVLDAVIRHRLPVHYVANGQRVPEDLHPANRQYLLHRALRPAREGSPRTLSDGELALLMAGTPSLAMEGGAIGQV